MIYNYAVSIRHSALRHQCIPFHSLHATGIKGKQSQKGDKLLADSQSVER